MLAALRILLVEDNEMNQQVATELLESAGAGVTVADHGGIALKILREGPDKPEFDVVLMDLQMPEVDGLTATRMIRAEPRFNDLPDHRHDRPRARRRARALYTGRHDRPCH